MSSRPTSPCNAIRELTSLSLDTEPSKIEQRLIAAHTASCARCAEFAADVELIATTLRSARLEPVPSPIIPTRRWLGMRGHLRPFAQRASTAAALFAVVTVGVVVVHAPTIDAPETHAVTRPDVLDDHELHELRRSEIVHGQIQIVAEPAPTGIGAMKPVLMPDETG